MKSRIQCGLLSSEQGASLIELALVLPLLLFLTFLAIDFGRVYYLAIEVAGAAHAGAEYGSQNPTDTAGMTAAAVADAPDVSSLSVNTATYGCECSDGSAYSASCSVKPTCTGMTMVRRVNVGVSATYSPLIPWSKIPVVYGASSLSLPSTITVQSSAAMRGAGS